MLRLSREKTSLLIAACVSGVALLCYTIWQNSPSGAVDRSIPTFEWTASAAIKRSRTGPFVVDKTAGWKLILKRSSTGPRKKECKVSISVEDLSRGGFVSLVWTPKSNRNSRQVAPDREEEQLIWISATDAKAIVTLLTRSGVLDFGNDYLMKDGKTSWDFAFIQRPNWQGERMSVGMEDVPAEMRDFATLLDWWLSTAIHSKLSIAVHSKVVWHER